MMNKPFLLFVFFLYVMQLPSYAGEPLALHPDNPHYFIYQGKPTVLITSAEHYGAVLNLDFDFVKYLDALAADGLNNTRISTGVYAEPEGGFPYIPNNTFAPKPGRLIAPWARSDEPGYANGGNKFDLKRWSDEYFARLKCFMAEADKRGIIVEIFFFIPMYYEDDVWNLSPMKASNNINGIGNVAVDQIYTLDTEPALLEVQEEMVRKIVRELNDFDNLYYEICNEPYIGGPTMAWHDRIVDVILETESELPKKHLISWNVQNGSAKVENPHPGISIFNFHYASPPTAVAINYGLNKVIGLNETGYNGTGDDHYRNEAWEFILAGGALYNHLDMSFTVDSPDGTHAFVVSPGGHSGGGGVAIRRQIATLKRFIESFDFIRMAPNSDFIEGDEDYTLAESGKQYAVFLRNSAGKTLRVNLPQGEYAGNWLDPVHGKTVEIEKFSHPGGIKDLSVPGEFTNGVALRIHATR
ncbi:MAG: hypothetical protein FWD31_12965 [Planctomycetaceae bacterium]|nr:hypothetical protein [Planctomycetaceae bacterium]